MQKLLMLQAYIAHLLSDEDFKEDRYADMMEDGFSLKTTSGDDVFINFGDEGYLYKVWKVGSQVNFSEWHDDPKGWDPLETVSQLKKLLK